MSMLKSEADILKVIEENKELHKQIMDILFRYDPLEYAGEDPAIYRNESAAIVAGIPAVPKTELIQELIYHEIALMHEDKKIGKIISYKPIAKEIQILITSHQK